MRKYSAQSFSTRVALYKTEKPGILIHVYMGISGPGKINYRAIWRESNSEPPRWVPMGKKFSFEEEHQAVYSLGFEKPELIKRDWSGI